MRIFDNPNHPHYGPVRRLWVILAQLGLLEYAETYMDSFGRSWDQALDWLLSLDQEESHAQRAVLFRILTEF